jgi:hypothetical protein
LVQRANELAAASVINESSFRKINAANMDRSSSDRAANPNNISGHVEQIRQIFNFLSLNLFLDFGYNTQDVTLEGTLLSYVCIHYYYYSRKLWVRIFDWRVHGIKLQKAPVLKLRN